jgi:chemotaxis protein CheD
MVGMADIKTAKSGATFTCLGLGSCIGLAAFDRESGVAGMIHIMLPEAFKDKPVEKAGKFADTGIVAMLDEMFRLGANPSRLVMAYAGGAQVFKFGNPSSTTLDVGLRNSAAVEKILKAKGFRVLGIDIGGPNGRTVTYEQATGIIKVRTVNGGEKVLCNLKG